MRRLIGCETELRFPSPITGAANIFTVGESREPVLVMERLVCWFWNNQAELNFIDNPTKRTLVLRDIPVMASFLRLPVVGTTSRQNAKTLAAMSALPSDR